MISVSAQGERTRWGRMNEAAAGVRRATPDLMINDTVTLQHCQSLIQVVNHLWSVARFTLSHTHTHTLTRARSATTAFIGVTDVFCNPVAPNAVDTWRSHLDQSSGAPQTVCVCVFRVFRGGVGVNMCVCCVFP